MIRVGVVADTHVGEHLHELPKEVLAVLDGVDLVVHAGDLTAPGVLGRLASLAPVVAVRGNHDDDAGGHGLPRDVLIRVGGRRIGVTHGTRSGAIERLGGAVSIALGRTELLGFARAARRRFGAVDAVVTGHTHMPLCQVVDGVLLFSPGAVYVPERDPWFDWTTVRGRAYRRFRRLAPADAYRPAVGVIEIEADTLRTRRIILREPLRTGAAGGNTAGTRRRAAAAAVD